MPKFFLLYLSGKIKYIVHLSHFNRFLSKICKISGKYLLQKIITFLAFILSYDLFYERSVIGVTDIGASEIGDTKRSDKKIV